MEPIQQELTKRTMLLYVETLHVLFQSIRSPACRNKSNQLNEKRPGEKKSPLGLPYVYQELLTHPGASYLLVPPPWHCDLYYGLCIGFH